jgi:hypothetical protein
MPDVSLSSQYDLSVPFMAFSSTGRSGGTVALPVAYSLGVVHAFRLGIESHVDEMCVGAGHQEHPGRDQHPDEA